MTLGTPEEMKGWSQTELEDLKNYLSSLNWFLVIARMQGNQVEVKTDFMIRI